ncbi:MAG: type II secretion system secretin GspD, partial [Pseudomonadota bacterium]
YTLNFDDADLGEVAKVILGETLNTNYTISPGVTGRVTLETARPLTREELIPTLEMILRMNDMALLRDGGGYRIEPATKALRGAGAPKLGRPGRSLPPGYQVRIIPLEFVGVEEIKAILEPLIPPKAILRVDKMRNLLLVAGSSQELEQVIDTIDIFDVDVMKGMSFGLFPLQNVDVGTVLKELEALFGESSETPLAGMFRMLPIERLNALLLITPQARYLTEAKRWIDRLDRAKSAAGGGVHVYRVQNVDAVELADTLSAIFGRGAQKRDKPPSLAPGLKPATISDKTSAADTKEKRTPARGTQGSSLVAELGEVKIIADAVNNTLIIVATAQEFEQIMAVVKQLDVMPLQVLIDAAIVEVTLRDQLQYGVQWSVESGSLRAILSRVASGEITEFGPTTGFSLAFTGADIRAVLNALAADSKLNVISTPSLMVLNNQEASINVGDSVPIATSQSTNTSSATVISGDDTETGVPTTGAIVTNNIQMIDTGVILKVKPRVNAGGLVIMEIDQQANQAVETTTSGLDTPTIQQRKINSSIAIQSGETIVLGGLIREQNQRSRDGVPFLSRLPLIGPLFGNTNKVMDRTELIVLITPRVVENGNDARKITNEFRRKLTGIYHRPPPHAAVAGDSVDVTTQPYP